MNDWNLSIQAIHEPWRLWTCHITHHDWQHAADNLLALSIPLVLALRRDRIRNGIWLFALAPILSLTLLPFLQNGTYCGLSGLACALWAMVGLQLMIREESAGVGVMMIALLALKFMVESMTGCGILQHSGRWQTLSESHVSGTLLGLCAGLGALIGLRPKIAPKKHCTRPIGNSYWRRVRPIISMS